ncbi:MAG: Uma2 family endonuclease [Mycobacteriales bacterium]|nr:Uma2 family endonuclease [Frankia sp.]
MTSTAPYTLADMNDFPDDGRRYELLDGALLVTPAPRERHHVVAAALFRLLDAARPRDMLVYPAPSNVNREPSTNLQPDLSVRWRADFERAANETTPLLVIEILSPSTRRVDELLKRDAYARIGVPSYWLVDPDEPVTLTVLELESPGQYVERARVRADQPCEVVQPYPLRIVPSTLLADLRD